MWVNYSSLKEKVKQQQSKKYSTTKILLENIQNHQKQNTKIVLPVMEDLEIIFCEADDNFTRFHLHQGHPLMICRTLKFFQILEPLGFLRIHKSHMINLEKEKKYVKGKGGYVMLQNDQELAVSPNKKGLLIDQLG